MTTSKSTTSNAEFSLAYIRHANPDLAHLSWHEINATLAARYSEARALHMLAHPVPSPEHLETQEALRLLIGGPLKLQRDNFPMDSVPAEHDFLGLWQKPLPEEPSAPISPPSSPPRQGLLSRILTRLHSWSWKSAKR